MSRRWWTAILFAAALLASGCGEREEPLGKLAPDYPVEVRGADDEPAVLRREPARIVALEAGSAALVGRIGAGARLVGVPTGSPVPAGAGAEVVVPASGQVNVDAVVRLRPDLIVATRATDPVDVSRAERESEAEVYVQPAESIADVRRAAVELGFLVGEALRARRLAVSIQRDVAALDGRLADVRPVSVFVDTGFFVTVPADSLLGDLVRRARGRSVAGARPGLEPFDLDELARLDPTVYLATSASRVSLARLRANPKTRGLTAVEEGRVVVLPDELVSSAGPSVAEALEAIARALHPDAFR